MPITNPFSALSADELSATTEAVRLGLAVPDINTVSFVGEDYVVGSISWKASLGRPMDVPIEAGFAILLGHKQAVLDVTPPAHHILFPVYEVINGKSDASVLGSDEHTVLFTAGGLEQRAYWVEVALVESVAWTDELPFVRRKMSTPVRNFQKGAGAVLLKPFNVIERPLSELTGQP